MKPVALLLFILLTIVGAKGCASGKPKSYQNADSGLALHCSDVRNELVAIKAYGGKAVSVCPVGGDEDCLYSQQAGKTFLYATPDLNADGRRDALIKDFSGAYGQHDVVHVMAFAQCADGSYIKVADDMLQNAVPEPSNNQGQWADLQVTRTCYNEDLGESQLRRFSLKFQALLFRYGPPENDPELAEFCTAKELSLPPE